MATYDEHEDPRDRRQTRSVEERIADLEIRVSVAEEWRRRIESTMNSRFDALDVGLKLVAERIDRLFAVKERLIGAFALLAFLGIGGIVGGILTIVRAFQPPTVIQQRTP